jgi:drug/metabolite transporter (DMT)-like permease
MSVQPSHDHRKGIALTAAGGLLLTFDTPLLRLVDGDTWTVMFWRGLLMFAILGLFWLWMRLARGRAAPFVNGPAGLAVGLLYGAANVFFVMSLHLTTVANLVFVLALTPMAAAALSRLFLGERISRPTLIAMVCALGGVALIVRGGIAHATVLGDLLAAATTLCLAGALTITRSTGRDMSLTPGIGGLVAAIVSLALADSLELGSHQWGFMAVNAILVLPLSSALLALGPRYIPAAEVAMFYLLETVLAPIWVWLAVGEEPTVSSLAGGAIIIVTLTIHSLWRLMRGRSSQPPVTPKAHP